MRRCMATLLSILITFTLCACAEEKAAQYAKPQNLTIKTNEKKNGTVTAYMKNGEISYQCSGEIKIDRNGNDIEVKLYTLAE